MLHEFICLLSVGEVGVAVIFCRVGVVVGLRRPRLRKGFAELSYETRGAPVHSVEWGLSLGVYVVGGRVVWCVRVGEDGFVMRGWSFCSLVDLLHLFFIIVLASVPG